MTAVRELVTRLSFTFNRANLDKFENSIVNFKKNIVTTTGDIASAVSKTIDFFSNLANSSLKIRDIADYAGIAREEFVAMRAAASSLGISTESFDKGITKFTHSLVEAQHGFGNFIRLVQASNYKIRLPDSLLSSTENFKRALSDTFEYINSLPDLQSKLYVLGDIFDVESASEWLTVIEKGKEAFIAAIEKNREFGKVFVDQIEDAKLYQQQIAILSTEWEKLAFTIKSKALPVLNSFLRGSNKIIEDVPKFAEQGGGGIGGFFKSIASAPFELLNLYANKNNNPDSLQNIMNRNLNTVTNNNKIEINVAAGTPESQAVFMAEKLQETLESFWDEKSREVINNNIMVE